MKPIICFLIILCCPCLLSGQKKTQVSFIFPDSTEIKKVSFYYYDHKDGTDKPLKPSYHHNKATVSLTYTTLYPVISVSDNNSFLSMYTTANKATVTFNRTDSLQDCKMENAVNNNNAFAAEATYVEEAEKHYRQLYDSIAPNWQPSDSAGFKKVNDAKLAVDLKRLENIAAHPNDYSSFILFRRMSFKGLAPDLLLTRFNAIFPAEIRNSEEGVQLRELLLKRVALEGKRQVIPFVSRDINNEKVILKDIYDKKYVLLAFWGTWCAPCIAEIPDLKEIRQRYPKEQLEIISIAAVSEQEKVRELVKEHQMDWIHIVNDEFIARNYPIYGYPETFLIDTKGNIVYKYSDYPDAHLGNLKRILDKQRTPL